MYQANKDVQLCYDQIMEQTLLQLQRDHPHIPEAYFTELEASWKENLMHIQRNTIAADWVEVEGKAGRRRQKTVDVVRQDGEVPNEYVHSIGCPPKHLPRKNQLDGFEGALDGEIQVYDEQDVILVDKECPPMHTILGYSMYQRMGRYRRQKRMTTVYYLLLSVGGRDYLFKRATIIHTL